MWRRITGRASTSAIAGGLSGLGAENHLQVRHESKAAAGVPVAADFEAPAGFNPDSVRVMAEGS